MRIGMQALEFWKAVTVDQANLLESVVALLNEHGVKYCVIGGQAVNAYAEPVVSLDLDLAIAVEDMAKVERLFADRFTVKRFPHRLNITMAGSNLRVQLQTDPRYSEFVSRSEVREVLSLKLPMARVEDVLEGKIWAAMDSERRASKRQKDLADIARLIENYPKLRERVRAEVLARLV